jgi:hypothetical protein
MRLNVAEVSRIARVRYHKAKKILTEAGLIGRPAKKVGRPAKKLSLLGAAAEVLGKRPLRLMEILARIDRRGLWRSPNGCKSPRQALSAAIQRSIRQAGPFRRAGRGLFVAAK